MRELTARIAELQVIDRLGFWRMWFFKPRGRYVILHTWARSCVLVRVCLREGNGLNSRKQGVLGL